MNSIVYDNSLTPYPAQSDCILNSLPLFAAPLHHAHHHEHPAH